MIGIDLGSNTLRIIQFDCDNAQYVNAFEKIVKTADNLASTGVVSDDAVQRVIQGIKEAKEEFRITSYNVCYTKLLRFFPNDVCCVCVIKTISFSSVPKLFASFKRL